MQANTIQEVIDRLEEIINTSIATGDRAGYFAVLYKKVTVAVAKKIEEKYFEDNEQMEKLDVVFANRYLNAWQQFKNGEPCSASWQLAFQTLSKWRPLVLDHLVLGMNAHIGLDLGIATATVAPGNQIRFIQNDFNKINNILNGLVNEVKKDLFSIWPLSKWIQGKGMDKIEEVIAGFSMKIARDAAWASANAYAALGTAEKKVNYVEERDIKVMEFGSKIIQPNQLLQVLLFMVRIFEFGNIPDKIKKLNK